MYKKECKSEDMKVWERLSIEDLGWISPPGTVSLLVTVDDVSYSLEAFTPVSELIKQAEELVR